MRILPILLCWLIYATACVSKADTTPVPLSDFTAPGGYSIHLTNVGQASPTDYTVTGTVTNTGKSPLTARITAQYLSQTGLPVSQQDFFVTNLAAGKSQPFHVKCPNYWATYTMTIHPGERDRNTTAAPLENIAPTSAPLSNTPAVEVQPLKIDSGNLYSITAEPAPPAADSNTTAASSDVSQDVVPSDEPAVPSAPLDATQKIVNGWSGKQFIFLSQSTRGFDGSRWSQDYAFWSVEDPTDAQSAEFMDSVSPDGGPAVGALIYGKFVGKIITCTGHRYDGYGGSYANFYVPDYGIYIEFNLGSATDMSNVAPVRELAEATKKWLGKTVYSLDGALNTWNSNNEDRQVTADKNSPLKIVSVKWGDDSNNPIWLVAQNKKGERIGFWEVAADQLNKDPESESDVSSMFTTTKPTSASPAERERKFQAYRAQFHWSKEAWEAIDDGDVYIGMLSDQVKQSLGKPKSVNTDIYADGEHQQWVYDGEFVYIDNGKVTAIQLRPGQ